MSLETISQMFLCWTVLQNCITFPWTIFCTILMLYFCSTKNSGNHGKISFFGGGIIRTIGFGTVCTLMCRPIKSLMSFGSRPAQSFVYIFVTISLSLGLMCGKSCLRTPSAVHRASSRYTPSNTRRFVPIRLSAS